MPKLSRLNIAKRGRRLVLLGLLAASGVGTGYVAVDRSAGGIGAAKAAVMAALADPLSVFSDRSPGARSPGALTQTKPARERTLAQVRERRHPAGAETPVEHVLASMRERPPFLDEGAIPFDQVAGPLASPADIANPVPSVPGPGPIPSVFPPIITGPGPVNPPPVTPPVTPPVISVPEPATWGMMILGFFGIGMALRRRSRPTAAANS
ncbi:PEPxxWA-CTERM sorting domain-containing protein [Sphingomonas sp. CL5.1]|nr:PEPxxWA-CTERM sorting domain-containing protein [Sphingomonas sp. CL5.1]